MTNRVRILGDSVALKLVERGPLVFPKDHVLVHDPSGRSLEKCALYVGPAQFTDELVTNFSKFDRGWFGRNHERHLAFVDVPTDRWHSFDRVDEIIYYRFGEDEGDAVHPFSESQALYKSGRWSMIVLSSDCEINHRGIVRP